MWHTSNEHQWVSRMQDFSVLQKNIHQIDDAHRVRCQHDMFDSQMVDELPYKGGVGASSMTRWHIASAAQAKAVDTNQAKPMVVCIGVTVIEAESALHRRACTRVS